MALDQARKFLEKIKADDTYLSHILSIQDPEKRLSTIHKEGYDFSREELVQVQQQLQLPSLKKMLHEPRNCCCIFGNYSM